MDYTLFSISKMISVRIRLIWHLNTPCEMETILNRRAFLKTSTLFFGSNLMDADAMKAFLNYRKQEVKVSAHLWVYASRYPPTWDCTPILEQVFSEIKNARYDGLEIMDINLSHDDAVERISTLAGNYKLPVTGCSFGGDMWNREKHNEIYERADLTTDRLSQLSGKTFGISVGNARRKKTEEELDAQASILTRIFSLCEQRKIIPNLHNHTYEVENDLHDLKGTLERLPDAKLGPDLNWLIRGGVDPVWFINTYRNQIVYMHLRDQKVNGRWAEAMGEGVTDFESISQAANNLQSLDRIAVELAFDDPATRPVEESWKISRKFVKKTFGW